MSSSKQLRQKLIDLGKSRAAVERKLADARSKESKKATEAATARSRALKATSPSSAKSYTRTAESAEKAALAEGKKVAEHSKKIGEFATKEAALKKDLDAAVLREATAQERERQRQEKQQEQAHNRAVRNERQRTDRLISDSESRMAEEIRSIRPPEVAPLRVLFLTAASKGDLRVDEEIRRVKAAVQAASHRDLVAIEHKPAATTDDLMDGLLRFQPHVVHFSGHANETVLVFDTGSANRNPGQRVTADASAQALGSVDQPPTLVMLNACKSEAQLSGLLASVPLAIGMSDSIHDTDAMTFSARFYSSVAEGQSVEGALGAAKAQLALNGLPDAHLPVLVHDPSVDPRAVRLVIPPN